MVNTNNDNNKDMITISKHLTIEDKYISNNISLKAIQTSSIKINVNFIYLCLKILN